MRGKKLLLLDTMRGGAKYGLSGTVADGGSTGIESVTITITGDASTSTTTAADGTWSFSGATAFNPGSYTVTPTKTNYTFSPASSAQTITNADISGVDFVAILYAVPGALAEYHFDELSGQVLTDYSGNGYHGQLGTTDGADTNDPAWNAGGWLEFGNDDAVVLPAALDTELGTGAVTYVSVMQRTASGWIALGFPSVASKGVSIYLNVADRFYIYLDGAGDVAETSIHVTDQDSWGFFAAVYDPSTRLSGWETEGPVINALTKSIHTTTDVPAALQARTQTYIGNKASFNEGDSDVAFFAIINSAVSDADMGNTIFPVVQAFAATKGITLP